MEVIHERCAGLDVHKETVVGCLRVSERGAVRHEVRRFATTTAGLLELAERVRQAGCTHVAMEATGVYWKPVWHHRSTTFRNSSPMASGQPFHWLKNEGLPPR